VTLQLRKGLSRKCCPETSRAALLGGVPPVFWEGESCREALERRGRGCKLKGRAPLLRLPLLLCSTSCRV